jgi:hypothetical protein
MIVVLEDDGCLHLYQSVAHIEGHIEALDADDVLRAVFDFDGQRYRIEWIRPNTRRGAAVGNGEYRLVPDGPPSCAELVKLIDSHIDHTTHLKRDEDERLLRDFVERLRRQP